MPAPSHARTRPEARLWLVASSLLLLLLRLVHHVQAFLAPSLPSLCNNRLMLSSSINRLASTSDGAAPSSSPPWMSEDLLESMWRSQQKPLLRLGRDGVRPSHQRSLKDLLSAHQVIRVKVNDLEADVPSLAAQLVAPAEGEQEEVRQLGRVLQIKNREFLVASEESLSRIAERAKKTKARRPPAGSP